MLRSRVHHRTSSIVGTIVKRIIDYRLSLGRESNLLLTPLSIYHPESDTPVDACIQPELGYQGARAALKLRGPQNDGSEGSGAVRAERNYCSHIKLPAGRVKIEGSTCNVCFVNLPSVKARENAFDHMKRY
jgi:hypothetical protein